MEAIARAAALLATTALGLSAGALLPEGAILVPFWRSLQPESFLSWYRQHASLLQKFVGQVEVAAAFLAPAAAGMSWLHRGTGRHLLVVSALLSAAVLAVFPLYFQRANASFAAGTITAGDVAAHQHPELAGDREDRAEHEPDDRGLFGAGESLDRVMGQSKQGGGEQHDECLGPRAGSEQLAEAFEQVPAEHGLFSEARADDHREQHPWERGTVPGQVMVRAVDRIGAEKRHHDHLHQEFECDAEHDAERQAPDPASGPHVADLAPWRA